MKNGLDVTASAAISTRTMNSQPPNPYGSNADLESEHSQSCPDCGQVFSRREFRAQHRSEHRIRTLLFVFLILEVGLVVTQIIGVAGIVLAVVLSGWALSWNKKVTFQCSVCGWSSSSLLEQSNVQPRSSAPSSSIRSPPTEDPTAHFWTTDYSARGSETIRQETANCKELIGREVTKWYVEELALGGDAPNFVWYHPTVPMLYLSELAMKIGNQWFEFYSFEFDPTKSYCHEYHAVTIKKASQHKASRYESGQPHPAIDSESDCRLNLSIPLPTGLITKFELTDEDGDPGELAAMEIQVQNQEIYLTAGSIEEGWDDPYTIGRFGYDFFLLQINGDRPAGNTEVTICDE